MTDRVDDTAAAEWSQMLTHQSCENGKHADWFVDSEYTHRCPWCERDELRVALDRVRDDLIARCARVQWPNGYPIDAVPKAVLLDYFAAAPSGHCSSCYRPLPHNETEQAACPAGTEVTEC